MVETYAVLGGMPYYLVSVEPHLGLLANVRRHILAPQGSLFAEVRLQLHEELRGDIEASLAILRAISSGAHRRADIARLAGLPVRTTDHRLALPRIVAPIWEEIARHHVLVASADQVIPFHFERIGSWWSGDAQIDVVGVNRSERRVLFGEAKWTREPATDNVLDRLIDRGNRWLGGDTGWDVHYALFAREFGQVQALAGQEPGYYFFRPEDVLRGGQ